MKAKCFRAVSARFRWRDSHVERLDGRELEPILFDGASRHRPVWRYRWFILADTAILERRLLDHLEGQRAVGGWIRDDLSIEHREVKISLSCFDDGVGDTPLITLLTACLISVEQANPMLNGDEIDFDLA